MANQFLAEIHEYISRQIETDLKERATARGRGDENRLSFLDGRLSELKLIRTYLSDHFDLNTQKYY